MGSSFVIALQHLQRLEPSKGSFAARTRPQRPHRHGHAAAPHYREADLPLARDCAISRCLRSVGNVWLANSAAGSFFFFASFSNSRISFLWSSTMALANSRSKFSPESFDRRS